jgi:hypothetical protein
LEQYLKDDVGSELENIKNENEYDLELLSKERNIFNLFTIDI